MLPVIFVALAAVLGGVHTAPVGIARSGLAKRADRVERRTPELLKFARIHRRQDDFDFGGGFDDSESFDSGFDSDVGGGFNDFGSGSDDSGLDDSGSFDDSGDGGFDDSGVDDIGFDNSDTDVNQGAENIDDTGDFDLGGEDADLDLDQTGDEGVDAAGVNAADNADADANAADNADTDAAQQKQAAAAAQKKQDAAAAQQKQDAVAAQQKQAAAAAQQKQAAGAQQKQAGQAAQQAPAGNAAAAGTGVNAATVNLIKEFEGFVASPEPDPIGLPTVGFGHLCKSNGCAEVPFSFPLSQATAAQLLQNDLKQFVKCVSDNVPASVGLNENQAGALTSFTFNLGCGTLQKSTLLKRLKAGEDPNTVAAQEIPKFNKAGGKVLAGLTRRRAAEVSLFQS